MMSFRLLIIILFISILFSCGKYSSNNPLNKTTMEYQNETLKIIHQRKSVRNFSEKPVSDSLLEVLTRAGMAAPSARNLQPWAFIIITEREILDSLGDQLKNARMLKTAQAAIIVCGDISKASMDPDSAYWVQDCSAATQNILLAAESLNLGAVWTAAYPYNERINPVREVLNIPENLIPLNVIPIGYPAKEEQAKDKWNPEVVFRNRF